MDKSFPHYGDHHYISYNKSSRNAPVPIAPAVVHSMQPMSIPSYPNSLAQYSSTNKINATTIHPAIVPTPLPNTMWLKNGQPNSYLPSSNVGSSSTTLLNSWSKIPTLTVQHFNPKQKQVLGKPLPTLPCNQIDPYSLPQLWSYLELRHGFIFDRTDENINIFPDEDSENIDGKGYTFTIPPPHVIYIPESTKINFPHLKVQIWLCEVTIEKKSHGVNFVHTVEDAMALCCVSEKEVEPIQKNSNVIFSEAIRFRYDNRSASAHTLKQYLRFVLINADNSTIVSFVDSCLFAIIRNKKPWNQPIIQKKDVHKNKQTMPATSTETSPKSFHTNATQTPQTKPQPATNLTKPQPATNLTKPQPATNLTKPTPMRNVSQQKTSISKTPIQYQESVFVKRLLDLLSNGSNNENLEKAYDLLSKFKYSRSLDLVIKDARSIESNKKRKVNEIEGSTEHDSKRMKIDQVQIGDPSYISNTLIPVFNPLFELSTPQLYAITHHYDEFNYSRLVMLHIKNMDVYRVQDICIKFGNYVVPVDHILDVRPTGIKCVAPKRSFSDEKIVDISITCTYFKKNVQFVMHNAYQFEDEINLIDERFGAEKLPPSVTAVATFSSDVLTLKSVTIGRGRFLEENLSIKSKLYLYSPLQVYDTETILIIRRRDGMTHKYGTLTSVKFEWILTACDDSTKIEDAMYTPSNMPVTISYRSSIDDACMELDQQNGDCDIVTVHIPIAFRSASFKNNKNKWWVLHLRDARTKNVWYSSHPLYIYAQEQKAPSGDITPMTHTYDDGRHFYVKRNSMGQTKLHCIVSGQDDAALKNIAPLIGIVDHFYRTPLHLALAMGNLLSAQKIIKHIYDTSKKSNSRDDQIKALNDTCIALLRLDCYRHTPFHAALRNDRLDVLQQLCEWMLKTLKWKSRDSTSPCDSSPSSSPAKQVVLVEDDDEDHKQAKAPSQLSTSELASRHNGSHAFEPVENRNKKDTSAVIGEEPLSLSNETVRKMMEEQVEEENKKEQEQKRIAEAAYNKGSGLNVSRIAEMDAIEDSDEEDEPEQPPE